MEQCQRVPVSSGPLSVKQDDDALSTSSMRAPEVVKARLDRGSMAEREGEENDGGEGCGVTRRGFARGQTSSRAASGEVSQPSEKATSTMSTNE